MDLYPTQEAKHQPGRTRQSCTAGNTHGLVNPASMPTASKPASLRTPPGHAPVFLRELVQLLRHSLLLVRGHGGDGLLVHLLLALVDLDGHAVVVPHALVHLRVVGVLDLRLDEVPRQLLLRLVPALRVVPARSSLVGQPAGLQEPEDVVLILLAHVPPAGAVHVCAGGSGNDLCVREAARERIAMRHADLFTEAFEQGVEAGLVAGIAQGLVQQVVARARHLLIEVVLLFLLLLLLLLVAQIVEAEGPSRHDLAHGRHAATAWSLGQILIASELQAHRALLWEVTILAVDTANQRQDRGHVAGCHGKRADGRSLAGGLQVDPAAMQTHCRDLLAP
mmetsp:Transcript_81876/g.255685  ORF Transcript_81876/g.255685 Transcript_81876/m.255685 type:complete len:336 (-) Transcript_81876:294-1301(-)